MTELTKQELEVLTYFSVPITAPFGIHANYIEFRKSCRRVHQIWKQQRKEAQKDRADLLDYPKWKTYRVNNVMMCNESNCFYIVAEGRVFRAYSYHGPNLFRQLSAPNGLKNFANDPVNVEFVNTVKRITTGDQ